MRIAHGTFETSPQREYLDDCIGFLTGAAAEKASEEERERVRAIRRMDDVQSGLVSMGDLADPVVGVVHDEHMCAHRHTSPDTANSLLGASTARDPYRSTQ